MKKIIHLSESELYKLIGESLLKMGEYKPSIKKHFTKESLAHRITENIIRKLHIRNMNESASMDKSDKIDPSILQEIKSGLMHECDGFQESLLQKYGKNVDEWPEDFAKETKKVSIRFNEKNCNGIVTFLLWIEQYLSSDPSNAILLAEYIDSKVYIDEEGDENSEGKTSRLYNGDGNLTIEDLCGLDSLIYEDRKNYICSGITIDHNDVCRLVDDNEEPF